MKIMVLGNKLTWYKEKDNRNFVNHVNPTIIELATKQCNYVPAKSSNVTNKGSNLYWRNYAGR